MITLQHSIKAALAPIVKDAVRMISSSDYRSFCSEMQRLKSLPRYRPTITNLLGEEVSIVDSCTFLCGYQEIFQRKIYEFNSRNTTPLIIDCGANIGLSVIYFKKLYPQSRIIAFEPDPNIFKILSSNIENLNLKDVELHQKAIWTEDGWVSFCLEGGYSGRIPKVGDDTNLVQVQTFRLWELLNQPVDFLKIDIEGAETAVLKDCQDQLANVDHLFLEYHSHVHENQSLHELLSILSGAGFRYHILEAFTNPKPFVDRATMLGMDLQLDIFCYRA